MTPLTPVAFGIVVWGIVTLVFLVFVYELFVIASDFGWIQTGLRSGD